MSEIVNLQRYGSVAVCTLTLEPKRNPLSVLMRSAILRALSEVHADRTVRSVIITGSGKSFCSGMDLNELQQKSPRSPEEDFADSNSIRQFFDYIYTFPKPTIAAVNGAAVAGGFGLALICDFTLASTSAFFSFGEVKIGFVPALVGVYLQQFAGAKIARDLLLTGRRIGAGEAHQLGLVSQVASDAELMQRAMETGKVLEENSPTAMASTKALLARIAPSAEMLEFASRLNAEARRSADCQEGVRAFLEKRKPEWR